MAIDRSVRLSTYATTAATAVTSTLHADIQVYDGPAIPVSIDNIQLDLAGLRLELGVATRTFSGSRSSGWWTCCSSTGGPSCAWSDYARRTSFYGTKVLSFFAVDGLATVDFLPVGEAPQGLENSLDSTGACFFNSGNLQRCGEVDSFSNGNCADDRTMYLGFTADDDGTTKRGWIEIERSSNTYAITRWAFQDDGSMILTGQVPTAECDGDLDGSGSVDSADLGSLLAAWGTCGKKGSCDADLDGSGAVDSADLGTLLASWGDCTGDPCAGVDCSSDDPCDLTACIDGICYTDRIEGGDCGAFSCCEAHEAPSCEDPDCADEVCFILPFCCDTEWETICAQFADSVCDACD